MSIVAELYLDPDNIDWVADKLNLVYIVRRRSASSPSLCILDRDQDFVMAKWGKLSAMGVYAPPRWNLDKFKDLPDQIGAYCGPLFAPRGVCAREF